MQLGCDHCGFVENENDFYARHPPSGLCPACGSALTRVSLVTALQLAREAAEADAWREQTRSAVTPQP